MALTVQLKKTQRINTPAQPYTAEAVEIMRAIQVREHVKSGAVTEPGEVFAVLLGMGYTRGDQQDIQSRAAEFVAKVREVLTAEGVRTLHTTKSLV